MTAGEVANATGLGRATVAPAAEPAKRATAARAAPVEPATPPPTSRAPRTDWRTPSHDEISERAYFIALEEDGGDEVANWLRAEPSASWRRLDRVYLRHAGLRR